MASTSATPSCHPATLATAEPSSALQRGVKRTCSKQHRRARCPAWCGQLASRPMTLDGYIHSRNRLAYTNLDVVQLARNHAPFMLGLDHSKSLPVHDGCVNTICWNETGDYILSGSDDCNLCITKPGDMFDPNDKHVVLHKIPTRHLGNIFCARFVPNSLDKKIVSCSSDGPILVHDIESLDPEEELFRFNCHSETIYEVVPVPDNESVFLSCGEDKTLRLFDMRVHRSCARAGTCPHPALIRNSHSMTTLQLHPLNSNLMLVGRADGLGLVYDRRNLPDVTKFTRERAHANRLAGIEEPSYKFRHPLDGVVSQFSVPEMEEKCRFTALCYNKNGTEVLASYSNDYIYLFNHDQSSNFELVQTLPKKADKVGVSDNDIDGNLSTSDHQQHTRSDNGGNLATPNGRTRHDDTSTDRISARSASRPTAGGRSPRSARISTIRVRGDWSDTGVNSVPLSSVPRSGRPSDELAANQPTRPGNFLEQVEVTLGSRRVLGRRGFRAAEIIAGPIDWGAPAASGEARPSQPIAEEAEHSDSDSDNSTIIDGPTNRHPATIEPPDNRVVAHRDGSDPFSDSSSSDNDDDDDEEETTDADSRSFEEYAEQTVRNLVEEANEQALRIMNNDESSTMDLDNQSEDNQEEGEEGDEDEEVNDNQQASAARTNRRDGTRTTNNSRARVSSRTRAKFQSTVDNLKSKYGNIPSFKPRVKYQGHRNSRTSIKEAIFWGDAYIMSGSDCGRIMVWEKETAKLVMAFQADERVVNCLAPNPSTYVLASSGIDYDIKLWCTQSLRDNPLTVGDAEMRRIVENNELMLDESRYTLSVPPHLFFRVLASLIQPSR